MVTKLCVSDIISKVDNILIVKLNVDWTETGWKIQKLDVYICLSSINEDDILLNKNKLGYVLMQIMGADKGQDFENGTATFPLLI